MEATSVNKSEKASVALLTGAGFASSLLCLLWSKSGNQILFPGALFGITVALYFSLVEDFRTPFRLLAFLCACSASYPLSILGALVFNIVFDPFLGNLTELNNANAPLIDIFVGGWIGACIVLFSGLLLFGPTTVRNRAPGATLLCTFAGGLLGLSGGEIDRLLAPLNHGTQYVVFVVWQTGVALMLGLLLRSIRRSEANSRS